MTTPAAPVDETVVDEIVAPETAPPDPPRTLTSFDLVENPPQEVPIERLMLSVDVPNFKENADERGIVDPLGGQEYRTTGVAAIVAWERLDGRLEVITGRHRLALAQDLGRETIPTQIVREADGFTVDMAATFDAESNILDGNGGVRDYANYFRFSETTEVEASSRGLLSRDKGRKGFVIGRYASDGLYTAFRNNQINETKTAAIAGAAPNDEALQDAGVAKAKDLSPDELANYISILKQMSSRPQGEADQADLFGKDDSMLLEAAQLARAAVAKTRELRTEYQALKSALKLSRGDQAKIVSKYGFKAGDAVSIQERVEQLAFEIEGWKDWMTNPEMHAELRTRVGQETPLFDDKDILAHPAPPVDSKAWRAWWLESKLVDENGDPTTFYHGTQRPDRIGTRFRPERAVAGPMPFFTDNPEIASGYAKGKADNSIEVSTYEEQFTIKMPNSGRPVSIKTYWNLAPAAKRAEISAKLPHVVMYNEETQDYEDPRLDKTEYGLAGRDHWEWKINREHRGNVVAAAVDVWLDSGQLFNEEEIFLDILRLGGVDAAVWDNPNAEYPAVIPVYISMQNPLYTNDIPADLVEKLADLADEQPPAQWEWGLWDKESMPASMWIDALREDIKEGNDHAWTTIPVGLSEYTPTISKPLVYIILINSVSMKIIFSSMSPNLSISSLTGIRDGKNTLSSPGVAMHIYLGINSHSPIISSGFSSGKVKETDKHRIKMSDSPFFISYLVNNSHDILT